ncbi:hypothetical protein ISS07_05680 [Candidatus Woesearchaeota archaeon]|nr:hypothetical protein [Candidatus Woesearchaeota archaeon]
MKIKIKFILFIAFLFVIAGCSAQKNTLGAVGSTHGHVDIKVYVLGKPIDFSVSKFQVRHPATHFENGDGEVLHTHATGLTLGYFFFSHGMSIDDNCLKLDNGNQYCSDGNAKLRVYVQNQGSEWEEILYPADYLFESYERILVTFGTENEDGIRKQMESVTSKASTI